MLFNSIEYLIFLPVVFLLYWFAMPGRRWQNVFIVVVSYLFYGWWDVRFLGLILGASVVAWISAIVIERHRDKRMVCRAACALNLLVCFGLVGVYKYYDFFVTNFCTLAHSVGLDPGWVTLDLVLPVGISFYTFQAVGYTIDVYRGDVKACRNVVDFLAFISFFPQLVAGPIERATNLLPQFLKSRHFDYESGVTGMRLILWGLFKKMAVADNCAGTVDWLYANYETTGGINLMVGAVMFAIQIYCDFSGYSDIALGSARLMGIRLMTNFRFPYFSRNISEFWDRWHISLTSWFRDYLYIPLGGNRRGRARHILNTVIVFVVSGFWHGAGWTYVAWGAYNAMLLVPLMFTGGSRRYRGSVVASGRPLPSLQEMCLMGVTFLLAVGGWVVFRAESLPHAGAIFARMFTDLQLRPCPIEMMTVVYVAILLIVEWTHRDRDFGLDIKGHGLMHLKWARTVFYLLLFLTAVLGGGQQESFIYFQF